MNLNTSYNQIAYTKIGWVVHVTGEVRIASDSSISGNVRFSLPYTIGDLSQTSEYVVGNVHLSGHGDANIDDNKTFIYATGGNAYFEIAHVADDDTFAFLTNANVDTCLLYTSPSPRDLSTSRMPSSA